jgi:hypothetical protein
MPLLHTFFRLIPVFLIPVCLISAWALILLMAWSLFAAVQDSYRNAKRMHQVPCSQCRFFTGSYYLKCPVHPSRALSEAAIDCPDYEAIKTL